MRFLLCLCLLLPGISYAQHEMAAYVRQHLTKILDTVGVDDDYADLEPIRKSVGDKNVVMLGEFCHGDGSAFYLKSRLIKFLHQKMGFDVLAFESDFYALTTGWDNFSNRGIMPDSFIRLSVYGVWTFCDGAVPVFDHIVRNFSGSNPLLLCGIDNQQYSGYSHMYLRKELDSFFRSEDIPFVHTADYDQYIASLSRTAPPGQKSYTPGRLDTLMFQTQLILEQLRVRNKGDEGLVYNQVLKNVMAFYKQLHMFALTHSTDDITVRDSMMASNLEWLMKYKYPGKKIIVWAHNGHVMKNSDVDFNRKHHFQYSMGYHFTRDSTRRANTFIVGFTAYSGICRFVSNSQTLLGGKAKKNSFEHWCYDTGYPVAFLDMQGFNSMYPGYDKRFSMRGLANSGWPSWWNTVYDGVIYMKEMMPCNSIK